MRPCCALCLRPANACICGWRTPTANQIEVLILQHPLEAMQPKGSARLLHMSLQRSGLLVGERFGPGVLEAHMSGEAQHNLLLYPASDGDETDACLADATTARVGLSEKPESIKLWVLDGTWRKSRKMLHLNPVLRTMPRLALNGAPPSQYLIRKAHRPDQLSTLEATCLALGQLEGQPDRYKPLFTAFGGFVASQLR